MNVRRLALLVMLLVATGPAMAATWRYVDDQGNVAFTDDPGKIPTRYRDRARRIDEQPDDDSMSLIERIRQVFEPVALPDTPTQNRRRAAPSARRTGMDSTPARSGSGAGGRSGGAASGGSGASSGRTAPQNRGATAPQLNPEALRQLLDQFPTDRWTRKIVLAAVAAWATGLFWVVVGAIVLLGFILATRSLISLVDSPRMRAFWRWGFPVLGGAAIAGLWLWRLHAWRVLYDEMCRLVGL